MKCILSCQTSYFDSSHKRTTFEAVTKVAFERWWSMELNNYKIGKILFLNNQRHTLMALSR